MAMIVEAIVFSVGEHGSGSQIIANVLLATG